MIGRITGRLETIGTDTVLVDVNGVGYIVNISTNTKNLLSTVGQQISLYTEMMVREDSMQLVGFVSSLEKDWFRLLISVQGVGAKAALAILGAVPLKQLSRSIILGNPEYIIAAPGVGPKIAKRILLELAQKALSIENNEDLELSNENMGSNEILEMHSVSPQKGENQNTFVSSNMEQEAILALIKLGYERMAATRVVVKICGENEKLEISDLIRLSLQKISGE